MGDIAVVDGPFAASLDVTPFASHDFAPPYGAP